MNSDIASHIRCFFKDCNSQWIKSHFTALWACEARVPISSVPLSADSNLPPPMAERPTTNIPKAFIQNYVRDVQLMVYLTNQKCPQRLKVNSQKKTSTCLFLSQTLSHLLSCIYKCLLSTKQFYILYILTHLAYHSVLSRALLCTLTSTICSASHSTQKHPRTPM